MNSQAIRQNDSTSSLDIGVVGTGAFGTALATAFAQSGQTVRMWGRSRESVDEINSSHTNHRYSGELSLPKSIVATHNLHDLFKKSAFWIYACPSSHFPTFLKEAKTFIQNEPNLNAKLVSTAKGLVADTLQLHHELATEILGKTFVENSYFSLSGPSFAAEILRDVPTCVTLAGFSKSALNQVQTALMRPHFRLYTHTDLVGCQLGGAIKNVLAIAAGVIDGMGLGINTQAAFINLGLGEMARLGKAMGARTETFLGFSGIGDLILTCTSPLSRNRSFGVQLGAGKTLAEARLVAGSTVEGFASSKAVYELLKRHKVRAPICEQVYKVLHEGQSIHQAFDSLIDTPPRGEWIDS